MEGLPWAMQACERLAQLQLAAMGLDEDFMNRTNKPLRDAYAGENQSKDSKDAIGDYCKELLAKMHDDEGGFVGPEAKLRAAGGGAATSMSIAMMAGFAITGSTGAGSSSIGSSSGSCSSGCSSSGCCTPERN